MHLKYTDYVINLVLEKNYKFETYPVFLLRSIIGNQLHRMYCMKTSESSCEKCLFNATCGYALFFETILTQNNIIIPGRTKGCHPFVLRLLDQTDRNISFSLVLVGDYIKYFFPVMEALKRAGEYGLGTERVKFRIDSVENNGLFVLGERFEPEMHDFSLTMDCNKMVDINYHIKLKSPLRLVVKNRVLSFPTYRDFISSANRRIRQLVMLYGMADESEVNLPYQFSDLEFTDENFIYESLTRWSSRQKQIEPLGGVTGSINLVGKISTFEKGLLEGAELFSIGKNTNFGLGNIKIENIVQEN